MKVSVTFDDLPLNYALRISAVEMKIIVTKLIGEIKSQKIPVAAFVNENKLEVEGICDSERVKILKMWIDAGIEFGNHTYSHKSAHNIPAEEYKEEILKGERTILCTVSFFLGIISMTTYVLLNNHSSEKSVAAAGLITLMVAWFSVGIQAFKAASINPSECLRDE